MTLPVTLLALLRAREAYRSEVYVDSTGNPTAGIGHKLTRSEIAQYPPGSQVPRSVIDTWIEQDVGKAYRAALVQTKLLGIDGARTVTITEDVVTPLVVTITDILASVNFQLGSTWIADFRNTWGHLVRKEYDTAIAEVQKSKWFRQSPKRVRDLQAAIRSLAKH